MILVDSCVWIDLLRGKETAAVSRLREIRQRLSPEICISGIIYFEVLRGIHSDLERRQVRGQFDKLERRDPLSSGYERLVEISVAAERKGLSLPRLGDWLILKTVLDHSLALLTSDRDFSRLSQIVHF